MFRFPRASFIALLAAVAAAVGLPAGPARAADPARPEWERPIEEGIASQDREISRSSPKAVLRKWESRAGRDADVVTLYLLARAYGKAGDNASALASYADVLAKDAACWYAWRDRGVLRLLSKDAAGAEADLRRAVALKGDYVEALQPLGMLLVEGGRVEEGVRLLQRAVDAQPGLDSARFQIVEAWLKAGRFDDAQRALDPLLARSPTDPGLRHVKGRLLAAKKDFAGARAIYRQLALDYPDKAAPLRAWLAIAQTEGQVSTEEAIWVLDRLRRVTTDAEEKKALGAQVDRLRRGAQGGEQAPAGKPTPEALAAAIRSPDVERRKGALLYVLREGRETLVVGGDLLRAIVERLNPAAEASADVRGLALAVFERTGDPAVAPLVRASLRDPDPDVRCKAADALGAAGNPIGVAALARYASAGDAALATSARAAIYALAGAAPPGGDDTPQAQAAAFAEWWKGEPARAAKLRALAAVPASGDVAPDDLAFPLALDPDPEVWTAAYRALKALLPLVQGASPRAAWMRSLPAFDDAALAPTNREAVVGALLTWWEKRPS